MPLMIRPLSLLTIVFAACASSVEDIQREPAPSEEQREQALRAAEEKRREFQGVLVRLDQAIDSYVRVLSSQGEARADQQAARLEKSIRDMVLDVGVVELGKDAPTVKQGENFARLQAAAIDGSNPHHQGIALAALGFSEQHDLMPVILQGAQLSDPFVVDHAVLGLAILRSPKTPPGVLTAIMRRDTHPEDGRVQAAWALYRIQSASENPQEILGIWRELLTSERASLPAGVVVSAVRGLGLAREPADADLVASFLSHPTPRVRMAAAVALARMNAQDHAKALIELLGPKENVQNVRLHARKALADLAGGKDYGYDVAAWRKVFDRGP
jgi:HEAT repeat protein